MDSSAVVFLLVLSDFVNTSFTSFFVNSSCISSKILTSDNKDFAIGFSDNLFFIFSLVSILDFF